MFSSLCVQSSLSRLDGSYIHCRWYTRSQIMSCEEGPRLLKRFVALTKKAHLDHLQQRQQQLLPRQQGYRSSQTHLLALKQMIVAADGGCSADSVNGSSSSSSSVVLPSLLNSSNNQYTSHSYYGLYFNPDFATIHRIIDASKDQYGESLLPTDCSIRCLPCLVFQLPSPPLLCVCMRLCLCQVSGIL